MDKPVIDPRWFHREVEDIVHALMQRFPDLSPATVRATTVEASERLARPARVATFLPVLISRDAETTLRSTDSADR